MESSHQPRIVATVQHSAGSPHQEPNAVGLTGSGWVALAVIATLYVAVAIYYYFRIVRSMFTREETSKENLATTLGLRVALAASGLLTLGLGVYPEPLLLFYLNHLAWELKGAQEPFAPAA